MCISISIALYQAFAREDVDKGVALGVRENCNGVIYWNTSILCWYVKSYTLKANSYRLPNKKREATSSRHRDETMSEEDNLSCHSTFGERFIRVVSREN
jgi:hypothetical protein